MSVDLSTLVEKSLRDELLTREEARALLRWPEDNLLELIHAAYRIRRTYFGKTVKLNYLVNIQSGVCAEDCHYCSQSKISDAPVDKYKLLSPEAVVQAAESAVASGAARLCLVASMRGPSDRDVAAVSGAVRQVKAKYPALEICACLGILKDGQAAALAMAGVQAYNHNLNTSERLYGDVCTTHTYADRVDTIRKAQAEGLSTCSGALFGMGETEDDVLDVAFHLRMIQADSIPINFLIPIPGTPLGDRPALTAAQCLRLLCVFRLVCPRMEIRVAGGREIQLRSLQPLGLYAANSIFVGDYLTTKGQAASADRAMIRDMGFEILGDREGAPPPARLADEVEFVGARS